MKLPVKNLPLSTRAYKDSVLSLRVGFLQRDAVIKRLLNSPTWMQWMNEIEPARMREVNSFA